jgi:hypothetical protein
MAGSPAGYDAAMSETLWAVLIGGGLTLAGAFLAEIYRGTHESGLDRTRRTDDRRIERARFQRANLEALQTAARELSMIEVGPLAPAASHTDAWHQFHLLTSRVDDDEARALAGSLLEIVRAVGEGGNARGPQATTTALLERTGMLIRGTF